MASGKVSATLITIAVFFNAALACEFIFQTYCIFFIFLNFAGICRLIFSECRRGTIFENSSVQTTKNSNYFYINLFALK